MEEEGFAAVQITQTTTEIQEAKKASAPPGVISKKLAAIEKLAEEHGGSSVVQNSAARSAFVLGDAKTGMARAEKAVELARARKNPEETRRDLPPALLTMAIGYGQNGDYPRAYARAREALELDPKGPYADSARAVIMLSKNRRAAAIDDSDISGNPAAADTAFQKLWQNTSPLNDIRVRNMGRRAEGRVKAIEVLGEARSHLEVGDPRGALDLAGKALDLDPALPDIYMQRGLAYLALKDLKSAQEELGKAISLWQARGGSTEALASAHNARAMAALENRDFKSSLADAEEALRLNPKSAQASAQRAQAREGLGGKTEELLADFQRAAELDPGHFAADYEAALSRMKKPKAPAAPRGGYFPRPALMSALLLILAGLALWGLRLNSRQAAQAGEKKVLGKRFLLGKLLGSEGMGKVYEGWDLQLERKVAIKRLHEALERDPRDLKRFLAEAKTVASLRHPNIVSVFDAFTEDEALCVVFELCAGETLQERLAREGKLKAPECLGIVRAIGSAVDYAHERGVIHRDLKPGNVMLERNGTVKVMDFDIARRIESPDQRTTTTFVIGTPSYMAPEEEAGEVSRESDLYALGICAYEMLAGRLPFEGRDAKVQGRFSPASKHGAPAAVDPFFEKALNPNSRDRFHSGAELSAAFLQALGG
ncbi:MAG: protein kinase [Elusimicrobia bacterium]|nr:protein kinase [Elusimicrobiota bacterium]